MKSINKNLVLECVVFATLAMGLNAFVFRDAMIRWNPSPLWIIVLLVAMRHGSPAGIIGGCVASGLHLWELTRVGNTFEDLLHRTPEMLLVPVLYILVGMYLGEIRERLARRSEHFQGVVADLNKRLDANEIQRLNLERAHLEMEKRIAGQADTLLGVYHNLSRLDAAETEDELWEIVVETTRSGMRAEAGGVWRLSPRKLLAVAGALSERVPPLAALAVRKRGVATVGDWVAGENEGSPLADMAGVLVDDAEGQVVLVVTGMEFGQLNRNSAIYFELVVQRVRVIVGELRRLERLKRISIDDPRLGLASEIYLKNHIHKQALLARRHRTPLCLVCCAPKNSQPDGGMADRLDTVLACAIRSSIRASDGVAWFADRKAFVVMLPQCDLAGAAIVMRNVAGKLDALNLRDAGGVPLLDLRWNSEVLGGDVDSDVVYDRLFSGMEANAGDAVETVAVVETIA